MKKNEHSKMQASKFATYSDLFTLAPSRAQKRMLQIVEAAIKNYAQLGVERTNYESIAKTCKVSRPLIVRYFKNKEEIFEMAVKYIRSNFQRLAIEQFAKKETPQEKLEAYVDATFAWIVGYPVHMEVWKLFFYYTGQDTKLKKLNTELVNMGHERIIVLLQEGYAKGVFAGDDIPKRAKHIQVLITGALVSATTETLYVEMDQFRKDTIVECLKMAMR